MENEDKFEEVKDKTFKMGEVGDYLVGTFIDVTKTSSPDKYGKLSHIYRVKAKEGKFIGSTKNEKTGKYVPDKEPTLITKGEDYCFFISNDKGPVIAKLKDIKVGQKFKIQFTELKETTKGNPAKIIKVFAGDMDQEYLDSLKSGLDEFDSKPTE